MKIKYDTDGKEIDHSHIVVKKGVCGGTPIIKGTRTSVANVAGYYLMGLSPEEIQRELIHHMPEEMNRLLTDQTSDFLFTPSPDANENLKKEGIPEEKIFLVGNIIVN